MKHAPIILAAAFVLASSLLAAASEDSGIWALDDGVHKTKYGMMLANGEFQECDKPTAAPVPSGWKAKSLPGQHCPDGAPPHQWASIQVDAHAFSLLTHTASDRQVDAHALSTYLQSDNGQRFVKALNTNDTSTLHALQKRADFQKVLDTRSGSPASGVKV